MDQTLVERLHTEHRITITALHQLRQALVEKDRDRALAALDEVDRLVGPHIRFEEQVLFPAIRVWDEHRFAALSREHTQMSAIIRRTREGLQSVNGRASAFVPLADGLSAFFNHTISCDGVSYLASRCPPEEQRRIAAALDEAAQETVRLTEYLPA